MNNNWYCEVNHYWWSTKQPFTARKPCSAGNALICMSDMEMAHTPRYFNPWSKICGSSFINMFWNISFSRNINSIRNNLLNKTNFFELTMHLKCITAKTIVSLEYLSAKNVALNPACEVCGNHVDMKKVATQRRECGIL